MSVGRLVVGALSICIGFSSRGEVAENALELQRVDVTGTRLPRIDRETTSPVLVIERAAIEQSGADTLKELLDWALGRGEAVQPDTGGRGTFAAGSSGASLRGLGRQSTLVLLNSRRVAPYPLADYAEIITNIDALPLSAVERVEVLLIGGAAVYGSDAVAGVVNVITRSDYRGVQANASYQRSQLSGTFASSSASLTVGFGDLQADRYHVLANAELYHRDGVVWSDVRQYVNPEATAPFPGFGTTSTYSYPGNVIGGQPIPGCDPALTIGGLCRYDRYQRFEAMPAADRVNLFASAKARFDQGLSGFAELLYAHTQTRYISPYLPYGPGLGSQIWADPSTGQLRTFVYRGLPAGHPLNSTGQDDAELRYRFADGPSDSTADAHQYRVLAGLRGGWGSYDWESAVGAMGGHADLRERGAFSDQGFRQVIGNYDAGQTDPQFFNRGYRIGQPNSAAVLSALFPEYGYRGSTSQVFADGKVTGTLMQIDGRPVSLATGVELRHERFTVDPSANVRSGDIVGEGYSASDASRTYGAWFAEFGVPVTSRLQLQFAGRVDKFPSFGAHFSPKIGLRFEASKFAVLRGTLETGFRAPNLAESAQSTKVGFDGGISDPKRCSQAQALSRDLLAAAAALPANDPQATLLSARADNVVNAECQGSVTRVVRDNPALQPETSRSAGAGLVLTPWRDATLSIDYWRIHRRNEIGLPGTQDLLAAEDDLPSGSVQRASLTGDRTFSAAEQAKYGVGAGAVLATVGRFENQGQTVKSGIDIAASGRIATPYGKLDVNLLSTYLLSYTVWSAVRDGYGDNLVGHSGVPRVISRLSAALTSGGWTNGLTWNYKRGVSLIGDYYDTGFDPAGCAARGWSENQCRQASTTTLDYFLSYTGIKDLTVGVNVRNLLGRRPPVNLRVFLAGGGGIIPQDVDDVMGRMVRLTLGYKFW